MGKLLLLLAVLFAVVAVLRVVARQRRGHRDVSTSESKPERVQSLLPCPQCGIHMAHNELAAHEASHAQAH